MLSKSVFWVFLFMCLASHVYAEQSYLFGPHLIERGTGKPVSETHIFNASPGQTGTLSIVNGNADGGARVSSLKLLLNGVEVLSPDQFNQGVGRVEELVSLTANNNLTIQVNGSPGSFVRVSLSGSPGNQTENPTASLTVDPDLIQPGQTAQLSWTTTAADSVHIEPDIGFVDVEGMIVVAPESTTSYLLTATGASQVTSSVTLTVIDEPLQPVASLEVSPEVITAGETATLTWSSSHADTVTLEPGYGNVAAEGTMSVNPAESTDYRLIVSTGDAVVEAMASLQVLSPQPDVIQFDDYKGQQLDGALVAELQLTVSGVVAVDLGPEIGVTVNGVVALNSGARFIANHVPLVAGWNDLRVVATNPQGESVEKTVKVLVEESSGAVKLTSHWANGLAPLSTKLDVVFSGEQIRNVLVNCYGPLAMELQPDAAGLYPVTLEEPGIYTCIADVEDGDGHYYQDRIGVQVFDGTELDTRLQLKWQSMKNLLTSQDIEGASQLFSLRSRDTFRTRFNAIGTALPELVSRMGPFRFVTVQENSAFYDLRTTRDGREFSFQVNFIRDEDGLWRIWTF